MPDFGPTNMAADKWYDQMAFTENGRAGRKTRLLRHGVFDWRHAVYGPHPHAAAPPLSAADIAAGMYRPGADEWLAHYADKVSKLRQRHGLQPYRDWPRSYRRWTTYEMSDHLPIWMELEVDYSDDYLRRFIPP